MSKKRLKLTDQVRQAVDESGKSRNAIAKATGIDKGALSRFMSGKRGLSLTTLDVLGEVLSLRISVEGPGTTKPRRRKDR